MIPGIRCEYFVKALFKDEIAKRKQVLRTFNVRLSGADLVLQGM